MMLQVCRLDSMMYSIAALLKPPYSLFISDILHLM